MKKRKTPSAGAEGSPVAGGPQEPEQEAPEQETSPKPPKKKEQKIIYIDDGSTVADMRGTYGKKGPPKPRSTFREKARTYFSVVKKMILPLLATLLAFTVVYLIVLALAGRL